MGSGSGFSFSVPYLLTLHNNLRLFTGFWRLSNDFQCFVRKHCSEHFSGTLNRNNPIYPVRINFPPLGSYSSLSVPGFRIRLCLSVPLQYTPHPLARFMKQIHSPELANHSTRPTRLRDKDIFVLLWVAGVETKHFSIELISAWRNAILGSSPLQPIYAGGRA